MSSRLFQSIREQRGLAYSVYTFSGGYADAGLFGVYAGCQPGKADEVLDLIRTELDRVAQSGMTDAEVQRGKGQMRGGIVLGLEDSGSRMTRIGKSELVHGDVLGVDDLIHHVDSVTRDDVVNVAAYLLQPAPLPDGGRVRLISMHSTAPCERRSSDRTDPDRCARRARTDGPAGLPGGRRG